MKKIIVNGLIIFTIITLTVIWIKTFETKLVNEVAKREVELFKKSDEPFVYMSKETLLKASKNTERVMTDEGELIIIENIRIVYNITNETGYIIIEN